MSEGLIVVERDHHATPWQALCTEALDHLRLGHTVVAPTDLVRSIGPRSVVLLSAATPLPDDQVAPLVEAVGIGATLIVCGGAGQYAEPAGVAEHGEIVESWVTIDASWPWAPRFDVALHAFGGRSLEVRDDSVTVLARWDDGTPAVTHLTVGTGAIVVLGPDVWQSIGRIQQGWPITGPGTPAPDGSAAVGADAVLRVDDGLALSYTRDRAMPDANPVGDNYQVAYPMLEPVPMFHRPQADLWRELVWQLVFDAADECGSPLAWLNYWPAGVTAVAHMSHDSDLNQDEHANAMLEVLAEAEVSVTWCHCWPGGYSQQTVAAIGAAGHEQALHYNALDNSDGTPWGAAGFQRQYDWADKLTGSRPVSNKNHYTRWEGWTEFYGWCEQTGIQIDESRGPSKPGTVGFPYGTSHVGFPISGTGDRFDVLSLPLHSQDLGWATHPAVGPMILDQAMTQNGVAHILFHGANLFRTDQVAPAIVALADAARRRGMPWWTAGQINAFERARRQVTVSINDEGAGTGNLAVRIESAAEVRRAGILIALGSRNSPISWSAHLVASGEQVPASPVVRHGRAFVELAVDIRRGVMEIALTPGACPLNTITLTRTTTPTGTG